MNGLAYCQNFDNIFALRACLHGGEGPQVGAVTFGGSTHLSCKRDQIKMRDYMDRRVTPPKRVTSPTWGPPPPCKQALSCRAPKKMSRKIPVHEMVTVNDA